MNGPTPNYSCRHGRGYACRICYASKDEIAREAAKNIAAADQAAADAFVAWFIQAGHWLYDYAEEALEAWRTKPMPRLPRYTDGAAALAKPWCQERDERLRGALTGKPPTTNTKGEH